MNRALVTLMGRASTNEEPDGNLSQTTYSKELDGTDTSWQLGSIRVTCSSTTRVDHHAGAVPAIDHNSPAQSSHDRF